MKRIQTIDLARGFTVLIMAPVHAVMVFSQLTVRDTYFGKCLAFLAEGPGAQLFMFLMGVSVAISATSSMVVSLKKSASLGVRGYLLNIVKFCLPMLMGWLPAGLMSDLNIQRNPEGYILAFFTGDILQFAAIAYLLVSVLRYYRIPLLIVLLLAVLVALLAPTIWDLHNTVSIFDYCLQLAGGKPPRVFFPLFPWLFFPLTGYAMGLLIRKNGADEFLPAGLAGYLLTLIGEDNDPSFYRTTVEGTVNHLGIVLLWLCGWHVLANSLRRNFCFTILSYCSRNITSIYCIQWILVIWMLPFFGYHTLALYPSIVIALILTISAPLINCCYEKAIQKKIR